MPRLGLPNLRIMRTVELTPREESALRRFMHRERIDNPVEAALKFLRVSLNEAADSNETTR